MSYVTLSNGRTLTEKTLEESENNIGIHGPFSKFDEMMKDMKFSVSLFQEDDGSFTGTLEELDLIENAPSKEGCLNSLLQAMKEYAQDFYNEFSLWSSAPNRKSHIPYVLKILSSSDRQLKGDMICLNGKN